LSRKKDLSSLEDYLAQAPADVRTILEDIIAIIRRIVPSAEGLISYRMLAFKRTRIFIYVGAFKHHIGMYPPVHGSDALEEALLPYRGPKGNLRFPLDQPIPYDLIARVVEALASQVS